MSLINQMLKDLENRSRPILDAYADARPVPYLFTAKRRYFPYKRILLIVLVPVLLLFVIQKFYVHPNLAPSSAALPVMAPSTSQKEELMNVQHKAASALTGITLQIQQNKTSLRFLLSQNTLYRADLNTAQGILTIYLDHTHVLNQLPPLEYAHSAIRNMTLRNTKNGDLVMTIFLKPGADVSFLEMKEAANLPELQLDLAYQEIAGSLSTPKAHVMTESKPASPVKKVIVSMTVHEDYQKALNYFTTGHYKQAVILLKEILKNYPNHTSAREALATILIQQGHKKAASDLLQEGIQRQPAYLPFVQLHAELLVSENKLEQALTLLQSISPPMAQSPDYYSFIASLHQQLGHYAMAAKLYEQLLTINAAKAPWWVGLGIALQSQNKTSEAAEAFAKARGGNELTPELRAYVEEQIA